MNGSSSAVEAGHFEGVNRVIIDENTLRQFSYLLLSFIQQQISNKLHELMILRDGTSERLPNEIPDTSQLYDHTHEVKVNDGAINGSIQLGPNDLLFAVDTCQQQVGQDRDAGDAGGLCFVRPLHEVSISDIASLREFVASGSRFTLRLNIERSVTEGSSDVFD